MRDLMRMLVKCRLQYKTMADQFDNIFKLLLFLN